jgi:Predicted glycosylase
MKIENCPERYLTPYKYGRPALTGSGIEGAFDSRAVDCPFVFYHNGRYHMMFVGFDGKGYQTGLAVSDDLIHWVKKGRILEREKNNGWDRTGAAGTWIIRENDAFTGLPTLKKIEGRYWMAYHAYPREGYEAGAAQLGLAWSDDEELLEWHRLPEPVFSYRDGAEWEKGGLYKACIISEKDRYYLFYNAKNRENDGWNEQIGMAESNDLFHWSRYGGNPIVRVSQGRWDSYFCADPFVVKDKDRWVMYYYGFNLKHAQDGIAFSQDLHEWIKLPDPIVKNGKPGEIDSLFAHKPSVIYKDGILYHFYCGVREYREGDAAKNQNEFRCITFASSAPINHAG